MPIFEFKCQDCGKVFEHLQLPGHSQYPSCPSCQGQKLVKLISAPFLPSSVGKPYNDEIAGCCGSSPGNKGCTPGSCCGGEEKK